MARTFTMAGLAVCACLAAPAFAQDFSVSSAGGDWVFGTDFTAVTVGGGFGTDNDERGDVIGFLFTVGDLPISVSAIGFWDADEDGFDVAHDGGIFLNTPDGLTFATDNPGTRNGIFGTSFQFTVAGDCDPCDMDCDGDVDAFDIERFLDCLFP